MSTKGGVQLSSHALQGKGAITLALSPLSSWLECRYAGEPSVLPSLMQTMVASWDGRTTRWKEPEFPIPSLKSQFEK